MSEEEEYRQSLMNLSERIPSFLEEYILTGKFVESNDEIENKLSNLPEWKKEVWSRLHSSVFRNAQVAHDGENNPNVLGQLSGLAANVSGYLENVELSEEEEQALEGIYFHENSEEDLSGFFANLMKVKEWPKQVLEQDHQTQSQFFEGYSKTVGSLFNEQQALANTDEPTNIYLTLLLFDKQIEQLEGRKNIFDFLKKRLGDEMPHDIFSFKKICKRIKLTGKIYRDEHDAGGGDA